MSIAVNGIPFEDLLTPPFDCDHCGPTWHVGSQCPNKNSFRPSVRDYPLTEELVRLATTKENEVWFGCEDEPNLRVRLKKSGSKSYYFVTRHYLQENQNSNIIQYWGSKKHRRFLLGKCSDLTLEQAKREVRRITQNVDFPSDFSRKLSKSITTIEAIEEFYTEKGIKQSRKGWPLRVKNLFNQYVIPHLGSDLIRIVRSDRWLLMVKKATADKETRGRDLHKALKTFLYWASRRQLIYGNPLAQTAHFAIPVYERVWIKPEAARSIYNAAQNLGYPWSAMIALIMTTGETLETVRHIEGRHIDWETGIWTVSHRKSEWQPAKKITLQSGILELLFPHRNPDLLFKSRQLSVRRGQQKYYNRNPINLHTGVLDHLKSASGDTSWRIKDLRSCAQSFLIIEPPEEEIDL